MIICAAMLGFLLAGCGTVREQQNPQPKMNAPCEEWLTLCQKQVKQENAKSLKKADTKKNKNAKKGKKGKKNKKAKKNESK